MARHQQGGAPTTQRRYPRIECQRAPRDTGIRLEPASGAHRPPQQRGAPRRLEVRRGSDGGLRPQLSIPTRRRTLQQPSAPDLGQGEHLFRAPPSARLLRWPVGAAHIGHRPPASQSAHPIGYRASRLQLSSHLYALCDAIWPVLRP